MTITALTPLEQARQDVRHYRELYEGLSNGTLHWSAWRDDLTCPDRTEVAREECWDQLRLAREELARLERTRGTR
jgi:hypothetical protein